MTRFLVNFLSYARKRNTKWSKWNYFCFIFNNKQTDKQIYERNSSNIWWIDWWPKDRQLNFILSFRFILLYFISLKKTGVLSAIVSMTMRWSNAFKYSFSFHQIRTHTDGTWYCLVILLNKCLTLNYSSSSSWFVAVFLFCILSSSSAVLHVPVYNNNEWRIFRFWWPSDDAIFGCVSFNGVLKLIYHSWVCISLVYLNVFLMHQMQTYFNVWHGCNQIPQFCLLVMIVSFLCLFTYQTKPIQRFV